jgi:hypothetical protein
MNPHRDDIHFSADTSGGWADPIGNDTILPNPAFLPTAGYLFKGQFPVPILLTFLHEATHHWCFETRLGYATSALWLRARRRAAEMSEVQSENELTTDVRYDFLDDVIRYWSIVRFLRPLAEGMALFSEHDLYSDVDLPNELLPPFYSLALVGAGEFKEQEGIGAAEERFLRILRRLRVSEAGIRRKAGLLSHSLKTADGGYLAGYLTVKTLWRIMAQRSGRLFLNRGLFLSILRDHIWNDDATIAEIFESDVEDIHIPAVVLEALQRRIQSLASITDDQVAVYEQENVKPRPPVVANVDALTPTVRALYREAESKDGVFASVDTRTLNRRHLMRVFSAPARVAVNEHGRTFVYPLDPKYAIAGDVKNPIMVYPATDGASPGDSEGVVEYHISFTHMYQVILVFRNREIVAAAGPEERLAEISDYAIAGGMEALRAVREASNELMERVIDLADVRQELDLAMDGVTDVSNRFYRRMALPTTTDEHEEDAAALLDRDGFWTLLDEDSERLIALSAASVGNSALLPFDALQPVAADLGVDAADVTAARNRIEEFDLHYFIDADKSSLCLL